MKSLPLAFRLQLPRAGVRSARLACWTLMLVPLGCAGQLPATGALDSAPATQPNRVVLPKTIITTTTAISVDEVFAGAQAAFQSENYAAAARGFGEAYRLEPAGPLAEPALFGLGTAEDLAGQPEQALRHYEFYVSRFPASSNTRTVLVRSVRLNAFFERWKRAGRLADQVMGRYRDLRPFEAITLNGAKALALVAQDDDDKASYYVEKARNIIERDRLDAAGSVPRDLALVYFALGEINRVRAERIRFVPVPDNFAQVLEQRCQLILDAQSSYSDTMRAYDAHWSAMAGYRVGELYQRLHADLMEVPPPESADTTSRERLFEGAMRLRYSILLDKAHAMMEHTVAMARRTEERSSWIGRAELALVALKSAMDQERAALDALPYSRQQLKQALEELGKQAAASQGPQP